MTNILLPDLHAPLAAWVDFYASLGWKLFPCRGKLPLLPSAHPSGDPLRGVCRGECGKDGHGLYDATDDPFQLAIWWRQHPDANIGWAMGHGIWTLDVDPRADGDETLFQLERRYGPLPHTLLSHTGGGGSHYPFLAPPGGIVNKADIGQGLDVQGEGSYIILPPSMHPDTGKPYLWDLVDGVDAVQLARAPDWLEHLVTPSASSATAQTQALVAAPGSPIPEGQRDNTLARLAINMARGGFTEAAIRAALAVENQRCVPPMTSAELDRIVQGKTSAYPAYPVMLVPTPASGATNRTHTAGGGQGQQWGRHDSFA